MHRFRGILCVLRAGEDASFALERAVALTENNQASLTVVDVLEHIATDFETPEGAPGAADVYTALEAMHTQELERLLAPYRARVEISTKVLKGVPFLAVIREVLHDGHDLVIKVPENPEWLDRLFGSDDKHLLRKCPCPVWLIKPQAPKSYRRILAAVDVGDQYPPAELNTRDALNRKVLEMASSLALADFAELHIVYAWEAIGESAMRGSFLRTPEKEIAAYVEQTRQRHAANLDTLLNKVLGRLGPATKDYIEPRTHLVKGRARRVIPTVAKQVGADLLVMGTVARTGIPGFIMGNTAETILDQIDCSVLAIKPPGFVTPVTLEE